MNTRIPLGLLILFLFACQEPDPVPAFQEPELPGIALGEIRDITSMELVAQMGAGINLGNTLDTKSRDKTLWGNPITTKPMIDLMAERGFKTLRIPVTWEHHTGTAPDYLIEQSYLARVEELANYAFANDMYVIINIHHDDDWLIPAADKAPVVKDRLAKQWTQIARYFENYSDYLIFETINEPRHVGTPEEWSGGTAEGRALVNEYHKVSLEAIRATGGKNALRHVMVSTYAAGTSPQALNDYEIPHDDDRVIVSLHAYFPFEFCLGGTDATWGTDADKAALDGLLDDIHNRFIANGRAVVMGEWSSGDQDNDADRLVHADYYARGCKARQLGSIWWEVGNSVEGNLVDRRNLSWSFPELADVLIEAAQ